MKPRKPPALNPRFTLYFLLAVAIFNALGAIAQLVQGRELAAVAQLSISGVCLYMGFTFMPRAS